MTNDEIERINSMNNRLLLVMGFATSVIMELGKYVPEEKKQGVYWVIEAVENIVYLDKALPPLPERLKIDSYEEPRPVKKTGGTIMEVFCCDEKLFYASANWSIAKCGKCGRNLNHE